jgi:hypothetical protein
MNALPSNIATKNCFSSGKFGLCRGQWKNIEFIVIIITSFKLMISQQGNMEVFFKATKSS